MRFATCRRRRQARSRKAFPQNDTGVGDGRIAPKDAPACWWFAS
jgi:hypothetical protein